MPNVAITMFVRVSLHCVFVADYTPTLFEPAPGISTALTSHSILPGCNWKYSYRTFIQIRLFKLRNSFIDVSISEEVWHYIHHQRN
jgi:hypothetical protein